MLAFVPWRELDQRPPMVVAQDADEAVDVTVGMSITIRRPAPDADRIRLAEDTP